MVAIIASLAATAMALRPLPAPSTLRAPLIQIQRTSRLVSQSGFYNNDYAGQATQWEPPQAAGGQGYGGGQALWRLIPAWGVLQEYCVGNGQDLIIGRFDMAEQKNTVSRQQAVVQVAPDGTATLFSLGKRPTGLRRHGNAPWYGLLKDAGHVLLDGEQIALDMDSGESFGWQGAPYTAVFTCHLDRGGGYNSPQGGYEQGYTQQGGYPPEDSYYPQDGYSQQDGQQQGGWGGY